MAVRGVQKTNPRQRRGAGRLLASFMQYRISAVLLIYICCKKRLGDTLHLRVSRHRPSRCRSRLRFGAIGCIRGFLQQILISATILKIPMAPVKTNRALPVWFLPANILVVAAVGLAVNGAVALLLLYKIPVIGAAITHALALLLKAVGAVTEGIAGLPGAYPEVRVGVGAMLLLYVIILGLVAWWQWRWGSMRWVAGAALLLLMAGWVGNARAAKERRGFVLYDDLRRSLGAMVTGRSLTLLCHPDSMGSDLFLQRRVDRHRRSAGLEQLHFLDPDRLFLGELSMAGPTVSGAGRWLAPGIDVAFHRGGHWVALPEVGHQAVVLLPGAAHDEATLKAISASCRHLVIAGNVGGPQRMAVINWCRQNAVPVHDVRSQGAFVLDAPSD